MTIAEISKDAIYNHEGQHLNIASQGSFTPTQNPSPTGAVFADVEVDTATGEVKILKLLLVQDSGRPINPATVEGQLEGGMVLGIGYTLFEDYYLNPKTGALESDNYNTYKVPSSLDLPDMEVVVLEEPTPSGPFGAKGVGMCGVMGIAPAIANAVYDAVGVRIKDMPLTPEKILKALQNK
jgi:xanthine dehydrogenase molybdenum-binding subunit